MFRTNFGVRKELGSLFDLGPPEPSRLPKFVQTRSAQHRLKKMTGRIPTSSSKKPIAVIKPIPIEFFDQASGSQRTFQEKAKAIKKQKIEFTEQSIAQATSKLDQILEFAEEPDSEIGWNAKTVDLVVDNSKRMKINQLEYELRELENRLQSQSIALKTKDDELRQRALLMETFEKEKKLLQELIKKSKEAHSEVETQLNSSQKLNVRNEKLLAELNNALDQEKIAKNGYETESRRLLSDLKNSNDSLDLVQKQLRDLQEKLTAKQFECETMSRKIDQSQSVMIDLQNTLKTLEGKLNQTGQQLSREKLSRQTAEQTEVQLHKEFDGILVKFETLLADYAVSIEKNGVKDSAIHKSKQELSRVLKDHENTLTVLKNKFTEQIAIVNQKTELLSEEKFRLERNLNQARAKLDETNAQLELSIKEKQNMEAKKNKAELKAFENELRVEEMNGLMAEVAGQKMKLVSDNEKTKITLTNVENAVNLLSTEKRKLQHMLDTAHSDLDQIKQDNDGLKVQVRSVKDDNETMHYQLIELEKSNDDLIRQLKKVNEENNGLIVKLHENEISKIKELEDQKRYFESKIAAYVDEIQVLETRIASLEKIRTSLTADLQTAQDSLETATNTNIILEKKIKTYEKSLNELADKYKNATEDVKGLESENHTLNFMMNKMQTLLDEASTDIANLHTENDALLKEVRSLNVQLSQALENCREMESQARRAINDKDWVQKCLKESEREAEYSNEIISRLEHEISQFNVTLEQKIAEKTAEFEVIRKSLVSKNQELQLTLESEVRRTEESSKNLKISEENTRTCFENLEQTRQRLADALITIKKVQDQNQTLSIALLKNEDIRHGLEQNIARIEDDLVRSTKVCEERAHDIKQLKAEYSDWTDKVERLKASEAVKVADLAYLSSQKKNVEKDLLDLQAEHANQYLALVDAENNMKLVQTQKSAIDRELAQERENLLVMKEINLSLELRISEYEDVVRNLRSETESRIEEAVRGAEQKLHQAEKDLHLEIAAHAQTKKRYSSSEKHVKESQFIANEERKRSERMTELVTNLEQKLLIYKSQREEAVNLSSTNLMRCNTLNTHLDNATERADMTERLLGRIESQAKSRAFNAELIYASRPYQPYNALARSLKHKTYVI